MKRFFSAAPVAYEPGLFLIRVITGFFLAYHGWEVFDAQTMKGYFDWESFKGFSSPATMVYVGKGAELVAGVLLVFGLFTRLACVITILTLGYIAFFVGNGKIWYEDQHPFMFVLMGGVFFFTGGGRYSLDHILFSKRR